MRLPTTTRNVVRGRKRTGKRVAYTGAYWNVRVKGSRTMGKSMKSARKAVRKVRLATRKVKGMT